MLLLLEVLLILTIRADYRTTKGRNTEENLNRNFGCPNPEGYRKALRLMKMADRFDMPIVSIVDTPGAFPGIGAEKACR